MVFPVLGFPRKFGVVFFSLIYFCQVTIIIEWVIIVSVESSCLSFLSALQTRLSLFLGLGLNSTKFLLRFDLG